MRGQERQMSSCVSFITMVSLLATTGSTKHPQSQRAGQQQLSLPQPLPRTEGDSPTLSASRFCICPTLIYTFFSTLFLYTT